MPKVDRAESKFRRQKSEISLRPIGAYPPACMPYGQEAAPVGRRRSEDKNRKTEDRRQESEDGGEKIRRSEGEKIRGQRTEGKRLRRSEGENKRTEVRGQRAGVRRSENQKVGG